MLKVAALVPYQVDYCAGQRFRIEMWAKALKPRGIEVSFLPYTDKPLTDVLVQRGHFAEKAVHMSRCFAQQALRISRAPRPDVVFLYREASILGPAVLEKLVRKWNVPMIYDIDEPLWVPFDSGANGVLSDLRFPSKVPKLMALCDQVLAANQMQGMFAAAQNPNVTIVPMAADMNRYSPAPTSVNDITPAQIRVCWTGTRSTQPNLTTIAGPLARLARSHKAIMRVIGDEPMTLPDVPLEFFPWTYASEVPQLHQCQIGVVPIRPDNWSPWKFFFKLVQMMALGLPVVAAPIGSNLEIIKDGVNGFLPRSQDEWYQRLAELADDAALRRRIGEAARETVKDAFGLHTQIDQMERIFKTSAETRRARAA
jgi:glycosyltransferase involved in cell wall biosynthesis